MLPDQNDGGQGQPAVEQTTEIAVQVNITHSAE